MPSNIYLFDPKSVSSNSTEKPLVEILREAELARSRESARIIGNAFKRVVGLFQAKKPAGKVSGETVKEASADETRLAA